MRIAAMGKDLHIIGKIAEHVEAQEAPRVVPAKKGKIRGVTRSNVIKITNGKDATRTQNFLYDSLNRVQQAYTNGPNWGETYSPTATAPGVAPSTPGIDAWGNLTNRSGVTGKNNYEALDCPVNANNQSTACYTYDTAGNLTGNGTAT